MYHSWVSRFLLFTPPPLARTASLYGRHRGVAGRILGGAAAQVAKRPFEPRRRLRRVDFRCEVRHDAQMDNWYQEVYLRSPWWKQRRLAALRLGGWQCAECGGRNGLDVHHLIYDRLYGEEDADLQVLCRTCHDTAHVPGGERVLTWLESHGRVVGAGTGIVGDVPVGSSSGGCLRGVTYLVGLVLGIVLLGLGLVLFAGLLIRLGR